MDVKERRKRRTLSFVFQNVSEHEEEGRRGKKREEEGRRGKKRELDSTTTWPPSVFSD